VLATLSTSKRKDGTISLPKLSYKHLELLLDVASLSPLLEYSRLQWRLVNFFLPDLGFDSFAKFSFDILLEVLSVSLIFAMFSSLPELLTWYAAQFLPGLETVSWMWSSEGKCTIQLEVLNTPLPPPRTKKKGKKNTKKNVVYPLIAFSNTILVFCMDSIVLLMYL